jgi:hypothetical protein
VIGWVLGTQTRTEGKRRVEVPKEIQVERSFDVTKPAADMSEFGVQHVNVAGDRIQPLEEEKLRARGMVFRPQIEAEEAARGILEEGMNEARLGASLSKISFSWLRTARARTTLVYYPLWVFRYAFRGRTYQALVDAEDGTLAYGQAPANAFLRALKLVAAVGGACFIATTILQSGGFLAAMSGRHSRDEGGVLLALAVGFFFAVYWGYRQFRYGSIIEEGSGTAAGGETMKRLVLGKLGNLGR